MSAGELVALAPALVLLAGAGAVVLLGIVLHAHERACVLVGIVVALAVAVTSAIAGPGDDALGGAVRRDAASVFLVVLIATTAAAALLLALDHRSALAAGVTARLLLSSSGAVLMAGAGDLLVLLAGLALLAAPLHALPYAAGDARPAGRARDVAARSAILLLVAFGSLLVYAATGSVTLGALGSATTPLGLAGVALIVGGIGCAAVFLPFHNWSARTYAGTPVAVIAFCATVVKLGAFAALLRAAGVITATGAVALDWRASVAVLAALLLIVASLAAYGEPSLKRFLVYVAAAQAGYIAVGAAAGTAASPAVAFALAVHAALTIGAFAAVSLLEGADPVAVDLRGVARRRPLLACAFGTIVLGLVGLPPTAGFVAKLYVFEAAIGAHLAWLVILGALSAVVLAVPILKLLLVSIEEGESARSRTGEAGVLVVAVALVALVCGIVPAPLLDAAQSIGF